MEARMSRARGIVSTAVVAALMLSLGAQCLIGQEPTAAQMACCAGTDHDCPGEETVEATCCASEHAEQPKVPVYLKQVVPLPAVVSSPIVGHTHPPEARSAIHVESTPLKAESPPKYVLLASFLI